MGIKYRYQTYTIGDIDIRLKMLRDLHQYADPDSVAASQGISKRAWPLFGMVWASSEILSHMMLNYDITGKRILEVGCGMALASHVLNHRGADITALDIHPVTRDLIESNAELNKKKPIPFMSASWGDDTSQLGEFDLIVGSDILYEPKHIKTLAPFVHRHVKTPGEIIIVEPDRGQGAGFHEAMSGYGFECESFRPDFEDHLGATYEGTVYKYSR